MISEKRKEHLLLVGLNTRFKKGQLLGEKSPRWKGGKYLSNNGYVYVTLPENHPKRKDRKGKQPGSITQRGEHILVAEKALGRSLKKGECVHHINGVRHDNRNSNLLICTTGYHRQLHERMGLLWAKEKFGGCACH